MSALAPHKMRRTDGTLIPVYALTGRFPGGPYYRDAKEYPLGGIPLNELLSARPALEAIARMRRKRHGLP